MVNITVHDWKRISEKHRIMKENISDVAQERRYNYKTCNNQMIQLSGDLDEKLLNSFPQDKFPAPTLPRYDNLYLSEMFYITEKDDNLRRFRSRRLLCKFAINYLDEVNKVFYNNKKNFNILKRNIRKICEPV